MREKVLKTIRENGLVSRGDCVTIALSGGADSVALLLLLLDLQNTLGIKVCAAHLNHMLRGAESDADEAFCVALCREKGIEFFSERCDVAAAAKQGKLGIEQAAREARYAFFDRIGGVIATAHTASDNFETMLYHLARGTALRGLCGIPVRRGNIIRPLLDCTREETEAYCRQRAVPFVTDSSNASDQYARNRIRHFAVPVLKTINPSAEVAAARAAALLKCDAEYLDLLAEQAEKDVFQKQPGSLQRFCSLHPALRSRVLYRGAARFMSASPEYSDVARMEQIADSGEGKVQLERNVFFSAHAGELFFSAAQDVDSAGYEVNVNRRELKKTDKINSLLLKNAIDCDRISGNLVIRRRLPADQIKFPGRGTKSLKKLFNEAKLPIPERNALPVAADDAGLVWVFGFGVAARCAVSDQTKRICFFSVSQQINSQFAGDVNNVNE